MPQQHVKVEQHGEVAVVRIDRPPANAMNVELLEQGLAVRDELAGAEPAAVVIAGIPGFFSAGVDLKAVPQLDVDGQRAMVAGINNAFAGWYSFPRPVVCAVNGHAIAGGLILALCGDYRVGGPGGKLGLTELRAGVPYPVAAMGVVRAELSPAAARRLALRADLVEMPEALELGLVDELVATEEDVLPRALHIAGELAAIPATGYERAKRQLRGDAIEAIERGLAKGDPLADAWLGDESRDAAAGVLGGD